MKMEFVVVMNTYVFLRGIIYRWNVLTILIAVCIPYLASHETGVVVRDSWVNISEASRNVTSVTVNNTSTNPKEGTSTVTGVRVNNSWSYPGGDSLHVTEVSVNKALDNPKESPRNVTKVTVNNIPTNPKVGTSHVTIVNVTHISPNSSQSAHRVTEFNNSSRPYERSRHVTEAAINTSWTNSNERSRRVTETTVNGSWSALKEHSRNVTSRTTANERSHNVTSWMSPDERSRNVTVLMSADNSLRNVTSWMSVDDFSRNMTSWMSADEGSAHGSLLDILGMSDDEDDDGDDEDDDGDDDSIDGNHVGDTVDITRRADGLEDDGGGGVDEAGSEMMPDVNNSILVTCFRCHGDGINGCDVNTMMRHAQEYSVLCSGKCLNVSSGSTAVFDCAHDMQTHKDTCLQNDDTKMCFCTGHFCNGPSVPSDFNASAPYFHPDHFLPHDVGDYDDEITNSSDRTAVLDETLIKKSTTESSRNIKSIINKSSIGFESNEGGTDTKKTEPSIDMRSQTTGDKNGADTHLHDFFTENYTHFSQETRLQSKLNHKEDINYIIPENNSNSTNSSVTRDVLSANAIAISDLRVGKLKDSVEEVPGNCQLAVNVNSVSLAAISSLLTLLSVL